MTSDNTKVADLDNLRETLIGDLIRRSNGGGGQPPHSGGGWTLKLFILKICQNTCVDV